VTRRTALLLPAAVLWADERSDVIEAVTPLAAALSEGDADAFSRRIPDSLPNRPRLIDNIRGLIGQAEITCSVRLVNIEDGRAELDWLMDLRSRSTQSLLERRKGPVFVTVRDHTVTSLDPVEFFKPVEIR